MKNPDKKELKDLDADEIIPGLWQGAYPLCSFETVERNFDVLVLCADELQGYQERDCNFPTLKILRVPLDDKIPPRDGDLVRAEIAATQVAELFKNGNSVLITCAVGLNRSGLVTALAVRLMLNKSGLESSDIVKAGRMDALFNKAFDFHVKSFLAPGKL